MCSGWHPIALGQGCTPLVGNLDPQLMHSVGHWNPLDHWAAALANWKSRVVCLFVFFLEVVLPLPPCHNGCSLEHLSQGAGWGTGLPEISAWNVGAYRRSVCSFCPTRTGQPGPAMECDCHASGLEDFGINLANCSEHPPGISSP